mmetsp:Transcript_14157/g.16728  ORF Transcript_14157/g.16728 Transcript_14157/m.16728 type:complete len:81 (-) Transcript_14157:1783-2025(-)
MKRTSWHFNLQAFPIKLIFTKQGSGRDTLIWVYLVDRQDAFYFQQKIGLNDVQQWSPNHVMLHLFLRLGLGQHVSFVGFL